MEMIADILLVAGAMSAGLYCFVLARRLNKFNDLEKGVGGAVAVLSAQVEDLSKSLSAAKSASEGSNDTLLELTTRAESVSQKLELMMASMHDLAPADPPEVEEPREATSEVSTSLSPGPMFVRHERGHAKEEQ